MFLEITKRGFKLKKNKYHMYKNYFAYLTLDEFKKYHINNYIYKQIINECEKNNNINHKLEDYDNCCLCIINIKSINNINKNLGKVAFIISKNIIIIIPLDNKVKIDKLINKTFKNINNNYSIEHILSKFIELIINGSFEHLNYIDHKIVNIEKELFENEIHKNLNSLIFSIKKEIFLYQKYFNFLLDFINIINFSNQYKYLNKIFNKLNRLDTYTKSLLQSTIHLREVYQSYMDFYQNRVIKILTVLTAIFLPLTLITGWYGMNLKHIPEIEYEYTYPIIIILCIIIIVICIYFFKKKKII